MLWKTVEDKKSITVSADTISKLKIFLLEKNIFNIPELNNGVGVCMGAVSTIIAITIGDKIKTISCDQCDCTKEYDEIRDKIQKLWSEEIDIRGWS